MKRHREAASDTPRTGQRSCSRIGLFIQKIVVIPEVYMIRTFESRYFFYFSHMFLKFITSALHIESKKLEIYLPGEELLSHPSKKESVMINFMTFVSIGQTDGT